MLLFWAIVQERLEKYQLLISSLDSEAFPDEEDARLLCIKTDWFVRVKNLRACEALPRLDDICPREY
jgi:hypothetical protein